MSNPPHPDLRSVLGLNLRLYRVRRGLTQQQLADLMATSKPRISMIERGATGASVDTIARLAAALRVEPWRLLQPDKP